jgi:hypothetical protein
VGKDGEISDDVLIEDPEYLRKSSRLINDALSNGMDVLQTDNGDIVTTGTKIVVTRYRWDEEKQEMVKLANRPGRKRKTPAKK